MFGASVVAGKRHALQFCVLKKIYLAKDVTLRLGDGGDGDGGGVLRCRGARVRWGRGRVGGAGCALASGHGSSHTSAVPRRLRVARGERSEKWPCGACFGSPLTNGCGNRAARPSARRKNYRTRYACRCVARRLRQLAPHSLPGAQTAREPGRNVHAAPSTTAQAYPRCSPQARNPPIAV